MSPLPLDSPSSMVWSEIKHGCGGLPHVLLLETYTLLSESQETYCLE